MNKQSKILACVFIIKTAKAEAKAQAQAARQAAMDEYITESQRGGL